MDPNEQVTYFAETDARNSRIPFGIKAKDRTRHVYIIGKTGMGKSTTLENMAVQDIRNGNGFAFMDPHGQSADLLLEYIPPERVEDVLYFAPFDMEHPISFNIMEDVGYDKRHLVVSGLMAAFKKIWQDAWSARMEYILSNTLLALLEYPDSTLLSVNRMYSDKKFREKVVNHITDTAVKSFWVDEYAKYNDRFATEATAAIQNKVGQFTSNPLIRNIVGQPKSSFDIRTLMDRKKILIINLSKGRIGEANANLLGSLLITKIYLSAMSRADIAASDMAKLPNFYLFVDEFQSFANETFADILSEARKYKLNLTIAHQYIEQMSEEVRAAVFGNVGTMITFRVGAYDAEVLEKEFAPVFTAEDIVNLGFAQVYLRLMIDGVGSSPFSARTLPPLSKPEESQVDSIIESSRRMFTRPRKDVEEEVRRLVEMGRVQQGQGGNGGSGGGANGGNGAGNGKKKGGKGGGDVGRGGNGGGQTGVYGGSQKTKPMFDEKTKNDLQAMLAKAQSKSQLDEVKRDLIDQDSDDWDGDVSKEIGSLDAKKNRERMEAKKVDPKKVSDENKNELQAMLKNVMGGKSEKSDGSDSVEKKQQTESVSPENKKVQKEKVAPADSLSEDDLRSMLEV